jgi:hypothetical protein
MVERRARQRARFVDAEPCRAILMEASRVAGRRPEVVGAAVGLSERIVRSMVRRDFPHVTSETADAVRRLLPLLSSERETA